MKKVHRFSIRVAYLFQRDLPASQCWVARSWILGASPTRLSRSDSVQCDSTKRGRRRARSR